LVETGFENLIPTRISNPVTYMSIVVKKFNNLNA
jgi:hypothetical protein